MVDIYKLRTSSGGGGQVVDGKKMHLVINGGKTRINAVKIVSASEGGGLGDDLHKTKTCGKDWKS